eukprot:3066202-Pyramimonas_sp.AAC.1
MFIIESHGFDAGSGPSFIVGVAFLTLCDLTGFPAFNRRTFLTWLDWDGWRQVCAALYRVDVLGMAETMKRELEQAVVRRGDGKKALVITEVCQEAARAFAPGLEIHSLVRAGAVEAVRVVVQAGANPNLPSVTGSTPLM